MALSKNWNEYINEVLIASGETPGGDISRIVRSTTTFRTAATLAVNAANAPNRAAAADALNRARRYHSALALSASALENMFKEIDADTPIAANARSRKEKEKVTHAEPV